MVQEPQEEKKEFLKREEIKTMAKDIARLREIEAQEEREKISSLDVKGGKKTSTSASDKQKLEEKSEEVKKEISIGLMPKPPLLKASSRKKYLIRGAIVFIVILILGSSLWFFVINKPTDIPETTNNLPENNVTTTEQIPPISATPTQPVVEATTTPDIRKACQLGILYP